MVYSSNEVKRLHLRKKAVEVLLSAAKKSSKEMKCSWYVPVSLQQIGGPIFSFVVVAYLERMGKYKKGDMVIHLQSEWNQVVYPIDN